MFGNVLPNEHVENNGIGPFLEIGKDGRTPGLLYPTKVFEDKIKLIDASEKPRILKLTFLQLIVFFLSSCKKDFIPMQSSIVKMDDFEVDEIEYKYLSTKSKFKYKNENQLINATLNTRIERDTKIWFSIRVALGVEAARGLITKDELTIIDRVNKQVIRSTPDIIERLSLIHI